MNRWHFLLVPVILLTLFAVRAPARDDDDIPSKERKAGGDANKRYFLIGPRKDVKAPKEGFGLVLVMPGGDGSEDFQEFVKSLYEEALPERYLVAQLVSKMWKEAVGRLEKIGAKVYLHEYEGGHGWAGDYQVDVRGGIECLEKNAAAKK